MLEAVSAREIAVSGLRAQRTRMNLIANNIANATTPTTAKGGAFRRQLAILRGEGVEMGISPTNLGVKVERVMNDPSPMRQIYEPGNPYANAEGYVEYPNVDLAVEMADLVSAQRAYEANIAVLVSGRRMSAKALEIIQA
ncbi:MAG: flagellar basal body rod protein FlgC [Candidatus Hydrogenedentes bacterium]|nr:flagellar basal body rod protein FlgC [Candidatus Hydrogenedentota bacterium]